MKNIFPVILIFFLISNVLMSKEYAVKIRTNVKTDLKLLQNIITRFDDVKISSNGKFIYNDDNNFITIICNASQLKKLQALNYQIEKVTDIITQHTIINKSDNPIPYQFGWPRQSAIDWPFYLSSATIADMNHDGIWEISVTHSFSTAIDPLLYVYKPNGAFVTGFPYSIPFGTLQSSASWEISAMGDVDGDGELEIVHADENGNIYAHKYNGSMLPGFPFSTGPTNEHSVPALIDVNNDSKAEIIITSRDRSNDQNAALHVFNYSGSGLTELSGFPKTYTMGSVSSPVVADIDNDGLYEIFVGTGYSSSSAYNGRILCYTSDGNVKPGWPLIVGPYGVGSAPSLYDLNNDNKLDVIIRIKLATPSDSINGIYAFDYSGIILPNFPFAVPSGHPYANVSIGDIDNDSEVEIGFGTVQAVGLGEVYVWNLNGTVLTGFPRGVYATWVDGSTAMGDVSGDGIPDIIAPTNGGKIYAFNMTGDSVSGFPVSSEATYLNAFNSSPTLVDIDRDGDVELFAPCNDRKIYCWDTPGLYDSSKTWSTYKGNSARTGTQFAPLIVAVEPISSNIPTNYYLSQNYPNPFNPVTSINFAIPHSAHVKLTVYNSLGKIATGLIDEQLSAGEYKIKWKAGEQPSGLYFYRIEIHSDKFNKESFSQTLKMVLLK